MTSNPKNAVTIVRPDPSLGASQRRTRVFVGDVELPVTALEIPVGGFEVGDACHGSGVEVQLTLRVDELHLVDTAPTRPEPELNVLVFKADPDSIVVDTEFPDPMRRWDARLPRAHRTITFNEPTPSGGAATVTVSIPRPKRAGGVRHSYNPGGAR